VPSYSSNPTHHPPGPRGELIIYYVNEAAPELPDGDDELSVCCQVSMIQCSRQHLLSPSSSDDLPSLPLSSKASPWWT
jgi:hypothetical protein